MQVPSDCEDDAYDEKKTLQKNGVLARVRSRWRSIFSKKNRVKLRDSYSTTSVDRRCILSEHDDPLIGTIVAQATVEPVKLADGKGVTLFQETQTFSTFCPDSKGRNSRMIKFNERYAAEARENWNPDVPIPSAALFTPFEIEFLQRLSESFFSQRMDDINIQEEPSGSGTIRTSYKPGPCFPVERQMLFVKQCLDNVGGARPPNMSFSATGWKLTNFERLFKAMWRRCGDEKQTFFRVELRDCVPSLAYLHRFLEDTCRWKGLQLEIDHVHATIHSTKSIDKKMRGEIREFVKYEQKVMRTKMSYATTFVVSSAPLTMAVVPADSTNTSTVVVAVRFFHIKCIDEETSAVPLGITVQMDQMTGGMPCADEKVEETLIDCDCLKDESHDEEEMDGQQNEEYNEVPTKLQSVGQEFIEMFPLLPTILERIGIPEDGDNEHTEVEDNTKKTMSSVNEYENEDTRFSSCSSQDETGDKSEETQVSMCV